MKRRRRFGEIIAEEAALPPGTRPDVIPIALRADVTAHLHIPVDLTQAEARKIAAVVMAYASDSDGTRSAETACPAPVPQDCQARAESIAPNPDPIQYRGEM